VPGGRLRCFCVVVVAMVRRLRDFGPCGMIFMCVYSFRFPVGTYREFLCYYTRTNHYLSN
jgi:hypothetical protein